MSIFKRKPKDLDAAELDEHDALDDGGAIAENNATEKKQRLILMGGAGVIALAAMFYVLDDGDAEEDVLLADGEQVEVSTDALLNRQRVDQEWVGMYENQLNNQEARMNSVDGAMSRVAGMEEELQALRSENQQMQADGSRVLEAYERENQQLRQQASRGGSASNFRAPPRPRAPGPAAAARLAGPSATTASGASTPARRTNSVSMVSFNDADRGTARRIDSSKGATTYTDSPNYLPPNSIATAKVVVGVDAATNVSSQSDPLPVLLRITGPARSVFSEGKLLRTKVQGCMVNGAAYGDLSSEKVYIKLQRMTCPQPGGRYAVSEVKGFISFGGKVGVRGRVVSREGSLTTQAFLAGLVSSAGSAINGSFSNPFISDGGRENPDVGEIGLRALGGGAEQAGTSVSEYLIERAEQYQPVIEMPTGANVEVVFLDGTFVRN